MKYPIDYKKITAKTEFYHELIKVHEEAVAYLTDFAWCKQIIDANIYLNLGSTLCIFLFKIENNASNEDNHLWVIVGDLPAMYLDIYGAKTTREILENYVQLAEDWITNVSLGKSIKNCYPFKSEPTPEMAMLLEKRISFIKNTLIDNIKDIPISINK